MKLIRHLALAAAVLTGAATQAQTAPSAAGDDTLYQSLGAQPGLVSLVDEFVVRLLADPRMNPFFKDVELPQFKTNLIAQFCEVSGGPCRYEGAAMKKAHSGVDIRKGDFNALVEDLQLAMDARGIGFGAQNRLLARLAPMHRDVINTQ